MAIDLLQTVLGFLETYGLIAVFILLVLDGAMLMPVLPGEAVMIMAVAQYAQDLQDLALLVALATGAAVLGSLILYTLSRVGGRPLIERHPRLFMMDKRRREKMEAAFEKPVGQSLVMFLRVIPLTRIIVNIPAGLAKMKLGRFLVLSTIGMVAFHAGFMYLAFEYQQPGSGVAAQAAGLQEAYATPAWHYLQANEVVAGLGVLALGAWFSFRSSRKMLKYPDGAVTSILGYLAVRVLFFGSMAVGALLAYDPSLLYELALSGGLDIQAVATRLDLDPVPLLAYGATFAWSAGVILMALEGRAKRRRDAVEARKRRVEQAETEEAALFDEVQAELEPQEEPGSDRSSS